MELKLGEVFGRCCAMGRKRPAKRQRKAKRL